MELLAQTAPDAGEWLQYGVLGLVLVALIVGWLDLGRTTQRERDRADRLEEENERLRQHNEDRVIPLLIRAMDVLERSQHLDRRGPGYVERRRHGPPPSED